MNATDTNITPGTVVKYARPVDAREAAARFVVVELRGDRVLMRFVCDLPIPPTECVSVGEVVVAE